MKAQSAAIDRYVARREVEGCPGYPRGIRQPVLVVQGSDDAIIPTHNSYVLQRSLPAAPPIIHPDANHGSFHQCPDRFVAHATLFLDA